MYIVTDSNVAFLDLDKVKKRCCCSMLWFLLFIFPAGRKNIKTGYGSMLYEHLILEHFDRKDMLAALEESVTGEILAVCCCYHLRGMNDFIQIPITTLLSQVDSSTSENGWTFVIASKNMVGVFICPDWYINLLLFDAFP